MYEQIEKPKENKSRAIANSVAQKKSNGKQGFEFVDNRHISSLKKIDTGREGVKISKNKAPIQCLSKENRDALKEDIIKKGYSLDELKIAISEKAKDEATKGLSGVLSEGELKEIHSGIVSECYTRLYRIQDELEHNKPRTQPDKDQDTGTGAFLWEKTKGDIEEQGLVGLMAASHTYGLKDTSSFVSLCQDVGALASTTDIGEGSENVSNVIDNAKFLCEYWVPNEFKWTPEEMFERIKESEEWKDSPMFGGDYTMPEDWVLNTPVKETEVLYYGWDLDKYLTNIAKNPYKKQKNEMTKKTKKSKK
ncbi:hypothetical protein [Marinomonas sp.]|uniref:hypothetical protein n=1 Tax=Marinomonas sp. TaxID=1904862 RepID=UPI003BAC415A